MKRQSGGSTPGGDPADRIDATDLATGGTISYASAVDPELGGAELLEDRSVRIVRSGHGRRLATSIPGALAGTLVIAAMALGAAVGRMASADSPERQAGRGVQSGSTDSIDMPGAGARPVATADASAPGTMLTTKQTDEPKPSTAPVPPEAAIELSLALDGKGVVIEWSTCDVDELVAYKVVRSKDPDAAWPLGAGDSLVAAIRDGASTRLVDADVAAGRTLSYRVVALRGWNGATVAACRSDVASIAIPEPTLKPTAKPTAKPIQEPPAAEEVAEIAITLTLREGRPLIDWTACAGLDFDYYKVVRSIDAEVTWPTGDGDSKVAAVGRDGETKAWDTDAPAGMKVFYRVFCIRSTDSGSTVRGASPVKGIVTEQAPVAPDPVALGFEVIVSAEGVILSWEPSTSDAFVYYKVVRSTWTDNPSYLPWTDGTELIGVVGEPWTTQLLDPDVTSGQTIHYRVQALGSWYGSKVLLAQTAVITVTVP